MISAKAQIDPFAPVTPTNRENINYLSTGPDLNLRLGTLGFMDVTARYARTEYQISPFNSNRISAGLGVGRALSAGSNISLQVSTRASSVREHDAQYRFRPQQCLWSLRG